ncbi:MAG: SpoIIE family protein phosphatase [Turneriella sp.]|nr:SpoIIE family protein phosphatase [Turneriella sp.]
MDFEGQIYLNFFSLGAFIPFIFTGLVALFLISLKNKSPASVYFAYFATFLALYNFGLVIASWFYHPKAAYHRYVTVSMILLLEIFVVGFFARFPEPRGIKVTNAIMVIQAVLGTLMTLWFFLETRNAPFLYHFDGHYWDFDADPISALVGYLVMINAACFIAVAVWRTIVADKKDKMAMVGLLVSILIMTIAPAITNTMSREGRLDRGIFQTLWDLFIVLGMFIFTIVYVNNTKDRTTFMLKIVGVSVATFLLAFQAISFFAFDDKESAYDRSHHEEHLLFLKGDFVPHDMRYALVWELSQNAPEYKPVNNAQIEIDFTRIRGEYFNTWVFEKLRAATPTQLPSVLQEILAAADKVEEFSGYRKQIGQFVEQTNDPQEITQKLLALERPLRYFYYRIRKLPTQNFRTHLAKFLQKEAKPVEAFRAVAKELVERSSGDGEALKKRILPLFARMAPAGKRHYRSSQDGYTHYTAFMHVDIRNNRIYEAGYSYLEYRKFIHGTALRILALLLAVLAVVLIGFRIFFLKTLVRPLEELLGGVKQVNDGKLDTEIRIFVEDEIGFLSSSFNNMVSSIRDAREKLAEYAETLEEKVKERTAELQRTLEEVQALKHQQDGDYFLTSLLTNPLCSNTASSQTLSIQFLIDQKKKFEFRKWSREIGGDLCLASDVFLRGRKHTFFTNADAMGKSIQGAGGIIVLGSVLQSILERTRARADESNLYPERWLKNAFIELHKIFETFDGSMLVSLVMGLIDDETGFLYYINAEHPWTVLYRDGKASFIESGETFRKLGTLGMQGNLHVSTFQLKPGDVIFAGSDGRDDLLLGLDAMGNRIINEDETLFLRKVEAAQGDLAKLKEELLKTGSLTDDLSIIRIGYREQALTSQPVEETDAGPQLEQAMAETRKGAVAAAIQLLETSVANQPEHPAVLRLLVKLATREKLWSKAALYAEKYVIANPADNEMIYLASHALRKIRNYAAAIDYGERLRLREPENIRNLTNLIACYFLQGNYTRAQQLLTDAIAKDPENSALQRLQALLASVEAK